MSTRSSIWYAEDEGKTVHIYWELAEREDRWPGHAGADLHCGRRWDVNQEVSIRLPKEIAIRLLMALSPNWADQVGGVL
jgi:hypothetical protein